MLSPVSQETMTEFRRYNVWTGAGHPPREIGVDGTNLRLITQPPVINQEGASFVSFTLPFPKGNKDHPSLINARLSFPLAESQNFVLFGAGGTSTVRFPQNNDFRNS